ncbi:hypothetical protein DL1_13340 [Thioclava dalianensis]|uniref:Uncharacterized protein n=1 Tax=Thioclava dalianensis TaxID=1185766 RepID=A0A074TGM7_9RHOB|nr:hypothetical protein [Thioclava dalianensis]KEP70804.1 hypothetical protein DL1_13340 [Thioclava dalianensis]
MRMLLEVEGKRPEQVREFSKIEAALRELNNSNPHSYANLTRQDGSYVQVAGEKKKYLIERRDFVDKLHWRAHLKTASLMSDAPQIIVCGAGQITVSADEIFSIEDVVSIWRSFFQNEPFASYIMWRSMAKILR